MIGGSGLAMMLKSFGLDLDAVMAQAQEANARVQEFENRLARIEATARRNGEMLASICAALNVTLPTEKPNNETENQEILPPVESRAA